MIQLILLITIISIQASNAGKVCCGTPVRLSGFLPSTMSGYNAHIMSDKIYLLDGRRAVVTNFQYHHPTPFGLWSIRLRKDRKGADLKEGTKSPLDQLGDYRDNPIVTGYPGGCERPRTTESMGTDNVTIVLPRAYKWKDVAWLGIYDYGYKYVLNYVWVNPLPGDRTKFSTCYSKACWALKDDPVKCHQKIKACTDPKVDCITPENYCYRACEKVAADDKIHRCGSDRRMIMGRPGDLYGCGGRTDADDTISKNAAGCGTPPYVKVASSRQGSLNSRSGAETEVVDSGDSADDLTTTITVQPTQSTTVNTTEKADESGSTTTLKPADNKNADKTAGVDPGDS